jgi:3',5'-cyclic AMP phosphodiesterase CpdA
LPCAPQDGTPTMSFVIAHITDPHLSPAPLPGFADLRLKRVMGFINWKRGRERLNDMALLKRLVEDLRAQRPDHVAVTGDLVNIGMAAEFQRAALWMETLGDASDVSFVPGNHDAYVRASMPLLATTFAPWATSDDAPKSKATYPYLRVRGEIAIIGLSSAVPTAPLMATGRLGKTQIEAFAELLRHTGDRGLARVVLIHHPPLARGAPPMRGLSDAAAFERVVREFGAEAILHGHIHRQAFRSLPSRAARTVGGAVPVLSAPSAAAAARDPRYRAAYHLVRLDREGELWRVGARARGLTPQSKAIGEREALGV